MALSITNTHYNNDLLFNLIPFETFCVDCEYVNVFSMLRKMFTLGKGLGLVWIFINKLKVGRFFRLPQIYLNLWVSSFPLRDEHIYDTHRIKNSKCILIGQDVALLCINTISHITSSLHALVKGVNSSHLFIIPGSDIRAVHFSQSIYVYHHGSCAIVTGVIDDSFMHYKHE